MAGPMEAGQTWQRELRPFKLRSSHIFPPPMEL